VWTIDAKDKHINKNKHAHIQTQILNMIITAELLYGIQGNRERKRE
jgi:hypothetical protein